MSLSSLDLTPRFPTRLELLAWVNGVSVVPRLGVPPERFDLNGEHQPDEGEPPCPIGEYLKRNYALNSVQHEGWSLYHARGHGITMTLDAEDQPSAIGYITAMRVVSDELGSGKVTREELADILKGWENPHDAADRIKHARSLAAT